MKKGSFLLFLTLVTLFLSVFIAVDAPRLNKPTPKAASQIDTNTIALKATQKNQTPFSLLNEFARQKAIILKTKAYSFGTLVEAIGNRKNTKEKAWIYFVNNVSGNVAADKYLLKPGDLVEWKYIAPKF
jgi:hypothetical protein